jgi:hypothetical protein
MGYSNGQDARAYPDRYLLTVEADGRVQRRRDER